MDARDILDVRRERAAEMNMSVSCSVIREGPGTGGRGADGGPDGGGLGDERSGDEGRGNDVETLGTICEGGMKDGGMGKASSRTGTAARFPRTRVSVVDVVAMVDYLPVSWSATPFVNVGKCR